MLGSGQSFQHPQNDLDVTHCATCYHRRATPYLNRLVDDMALMSVNRCDVEAPGRCHAGTIRDRYIEMSALAWQPRICRGPDPQRKSGVPCNPAATVDFV